MITPPSGQAQQTYSQYMMQNNPSAYKTMGTERRVKEEEAYNRLRNAYGRLGGNRVAAAQEALGNEDMINGTAGWVIKDRLMREDAIRKTYDAMRTMDDDQLKSSMLKLKAFNEYVYGE